MCDFSRPYYHDGTPVAYVGHVDDFYDGDCCCWTTRFEEAECPELTQPGMYAAGHSGCWNFYFDGQKTYLSEDEMPHGMYWEDSYCCSNEPSSDPKFFAQRSIWLGKPWEQLMIGDCIATCMKCFCIAAGEWIGQEGCKCKNPHWSMDSDAIRKAKEKAGKK